MDPLPTLATVIGMLSESEASPFLPDDEKTEVTEAMEFLAERLATVAHLVDKSAPAVNFAEQYPRGSKGKGPARQMLFDVARGLARRVPLTKLVDLDHDVHPFLAALMVLALHQAGEKLIVSFGMEVKKVATHVFNEMIAKKAG